LSAPIIDDEYFVKDYCTQVKQEVTIRQIKGVEVLVFSQCRARTYNISRAEYLFGTDASNIEFSKIIPLEIMRKDNKLQFVSYLQFVLFKFFFSVVVILSIYGSSKYYSCKLKT
jgi:hypothetical protein